MKRVLMGLCAICLCTTVAIAQTINVNWKIGNDTYDTSTCQYGGNLTVPTTPSKYGYTFHGWEAYTPVEYLESNGNQFINTGIRSQTNSVVEVKYKISTTNNTMYGVYGQTEPRFLFAQSAYNASTCFGYGNDAWAGCQYTVKRYGDTNIHVIRQEGNTFYLDGVLIYTISAITLQTPNFDMMLFGINNRDPSQAQWPFVGRIYYAKFWDGNGDLVRDFIPVINPEGIPCMFDRVSGTFFRGIGTENFTAGPVISGV